MEGVLLVDKKNTVMRSNILRSLREKFIVHPTSTNTWI